MEKRSLNIFYLIAIAITFSLSCDEIDPPYIIDNTIADTIKFPVPEFPEKTDFIKKVLLEEYTGHKCGNCPRAAEEVARMEEKYQEQIIPVALHITDYFGGADATGYFTNDYRTQTGNELNNNFGIESAGLPKGMINRAEYESQLVMNYVSWDLAIEDQIKRNPAIGIQIVTQVAIEDEEFAAHIQTELLEDIHKKLYLSVYLIEDSIISAQKDYQRDPSVIEDYVHRHMLRKSLNGTWGIQVFTEMNSLGGKEIISYSSVFEDKYNKDNCYIVAFVYDADTKAILQAEIQKIVG